MKLYLDTSIYGGYYDKEFEKETRRLFDWLIRRTVTVISSDLVLTELANAPQRVRELPNILPSLQIINLMQPAKNLAQAYLTEGALTAKSLDDAYHIAMATVCEATALVSWNFKQMVNLLKTKQYNDINFRYGYGALEIHSPPQINLMYEHEKETEEV